VQGYFDAVAEGKLERGADDFIHIHKFFSDSGLTLVGMIPDDTMVGDEPGKYKCIHNNHAYIVYLANPAGAKPGEADVSKAAPSVRVALPDGTFAAQWFNPRTGQWTAGDDVSGGRQKLTAPDAGDWVLLLRSG
jgi:hypothetical protein